MPPLDAILAVALAGFALSATPGPSMLYVMSHSVGQSRAAGIASAIGLSLGGMILAVATALGLGALFTEFEGLVVALRYIGSAYLVWIGVSMIRKARENAQARFAVESVRPKSFSRIVWQGILVELLNPKTVLFFALFLPPFTDVAQGTPISEVRWQLLVLGILVPLTAVPSDLFVACTADMMASFLNRRQAAREVIGWIAGLVLIAVALNLHFGFLG